MNKKEDNIKPNRMSDEVKCGCCQGDKALYWENDSNNAFVDSKGEVLVTVNSKEMRFSVNRCPRCGRILNNKKK